MRILHVDDDENFTDLVATFLEDEGDRFTVETATDVSEGLEIVEDMPPDCILSDYDMPVQDGIEFLRNVREEYPEYRSFCSQAREVRKSPARQSPMGRPTTYKSEVARTSMSYSPTASQTPSNSIGPTAEQRILRGFADSLLISTKLR